MNWKDGTQEDFGNGIRETHPWVDVATRSTTLIVGNLGFTVSPSDLENLFQHFGALESCFVRYAGRDMSCADVMFSKHEDALRAKKALTGWCFNGRKINIEFARIEAPTSQHRSMIAACRGFGGDRIQGDTALGSRRDADGGWAREGGGARGSRGGQTKSFPTLEDLGAELDHINFEHRGWRR